jgi:FkbM family methyltransferase
MTFARDTMVREGSRMVEVGTHHGFTAVLLATFGGPNSSLTCFEPLDENVAIARTNFEANELKNIQLIHAAVGDASGTIYIAMAGSNPAVQAHAGFAKSCRLVRLDDEIPGEIDFLKIDVEGFELHVLRGAQRLLRNRPHLQIEVHPGPISEFGGTVEQLFELIPTESYDFWIQPDTITEPVHYAVGTPIRANSHLFAVRKTD